MQLLVKAAKRLYYSAWVASAQISSELDSKRQAIPRTGRYSPGDDLLGFPAVWPRRRKSAATLFLGLLVFSSGPSRFGVGLKG